ncbi:MAG: hypothetical protein M1823_006138 [Watsoniomyces obsoletus]|nr:MAG: hypothetical protein M1823_006138 [Watsoniomyces obsoletus]
MAAAGVAELEIPNINLSRLLSRLSNIVLSSGPENELLQKSFLERKRVQANLDYARTMLLQLEQQTAAIKATNKRQHMLADLADRKNLVSKLNERLYQLSEAGDEEDGVDDESSEDLLGEEETKQRERSASVASFTNAGISPQLNSSLDRRRPFGADREGDTSTSKFPQSPPTTDTGITSSSQADPGLPQTEKLLAHNRFEQEDLTTSLLTMAQALKASSQSFASSLESEKEVLNRASEGLDKNTSGMEAAEKRMGTLRRMSEGRGWLGRLLMYAWIGGLWVVALVIVVILPKFRF